MLNIVNSPTLEGIHHEQVFYKWWNSSPNKLVCRVVLCPTTYFKIILESIIDLLWQLLLGFPYRTNRVAFNISNPGCDGGV